MLALTTLRLLYQCAGEFSRTPYVFEKRKERKRVGNEKKSKTHIWSEGVYSRSKGVYSRSREKRPGQEKRYSNCDWFYVDRQLTCSAFCSFLSRICVNVPASNSSTLWLMPTETSMNLARYVQAKHFPSADKEKNGWSNCVNHFFGWFDDDGRKWGKKIIYLATKRLSSELNRFYWQQW